MSDSFTRREALKAGALGTAAVGAAGLGLDALLERAVAAEQRCGRLQDIEHVVILIQENRSFDHYFGTYRGVRGFGDRRGRGAFTQAGYDAPGHGGHLLPFHLDTHTPQAGCTNDITHDWGPQHRSWNGGRMDCFVREHLKTDGKAGGPLTMAYLERTDIPFYHALADAFTLCDRYHCSVLGPTDPNRLYTVSATLDPAGKRGGPLLETLVAGRGAKAGAFSWTTMPEQLSARGVSWKVYTSPGGGSLDNVLTYFHKFQTDPALKARGLAPTYPDDFKADIRNGRLPKVSWVLTSLLETEHPGFSSAKIGEQATTEVLAALTDDPKLWAKTALFVTWDENGGFFDHVAPPAPPRGAKGEFLTAARLPKAAQGIRGPIGLGFRVPMIVVSPFSRGGFVSSDVFDHTSVLRFLETRFGAEVPNLSAWRRSVTGDLTSAFNFARPNASVPRLPRVTVSATDECTKPAPVAVPPNRMPREVPGKARRPSGVCGRR